MRASWGGCCVSSSHWTWLGTARAIEISILVLDFSTGSLLSLMARKPFVLLLEPRITRRAQLADRVYFPNILAGPHRAPHLD